MTEGLSEALTEQEQSVASMRAEVGALELELEAQVSRLEKAEAEVAAVDGLLEAEKRKSLRLQQRLGG